MNAKRLFHVSLPVLLLWLVSLPVHAAVEAGRILFARGTVSIVDESAAARGGSNGSVFYEGDRVVTGNNSIVQLRLSDGALTALRSNSDYHIERQRFDEAADIYEQAGRLVSGWMRSVTGAIGARYPGNVSQGTSVATIGIRGTTYQIIHVPDEGLAEFPNLQPGTYVYLEEGQVEVSNQAGSRIVSPGQVVRVRGPNVAPELAPELLELFQSPVMQGMASTDSDDVRIRDLLDDAANQIIDRVSTSQLPEFANQPFALSGGCSSCMTGVSEVTSYAGSGNNKYLTELFLGGDVNLRANEGKTPTGAGSIGLYSGGELVSQVHWGRWTLGNYTEYGSPAESGDWHYIMADNVLDSASMIFDTGLTGSYRYSYAGGSVFTGTDSDLQPLAPIRLTDQSFMQVDFSQWSVSANLTFTNNDTLTGANGLEGLYSGGLFLSNDDESTAATLQGAFVGQNAEGIMSMINYYAFDNSFDYWGSAVFQRDPPGPGAVGAFGGYQLGQAVPGSLTIAGTGSSAFVTAAELAISADGIEYKQLAANAGASPVDKGSENVRAADGSLATRINWGTWSQGSYSVSSWDSEFDGDTGDWHYMTADRTLTSPGEVFSTGLTGRYAFNYLGGSMLTGRDDTGASTGTAMSISNGQIVVDFGSFNMDAGLTLADATNQYVISGSGSVYDFYEYGLYLYGAQTETGISGSIIGMFAGEEAEAIISSLSVFMESDQTSYYGTAAFGRDNEPLAMQVYGGVSAFSTSFSPIKGVLETESLVVGGLGPDQFPSYAQLGQPGFLYELSGNSTQPSQVFSTGIQDDNDNIVTNVYWGIWDLYQVNEISESPISQTPNSDWHFMIADNPLTESMVASIGLTGVYTYFHVDGTPLVDVNGIDLDPGFIGSGSTVTVDFGNLMLSNAIEVDLDVNVTNYQGLISGTGSLSDLYSAAGIGLTDNDMATGSLSGTFAGAAAEALLSAVTVDYNTESYIGTALFEREIAPGVGQ